MVNLDLSQVIQVTFPRLGTRSNIYAFLFLADGGLIEIEKEGLTNEMMEAITTKAVSLFWHFE